MLSVRGEVKDSSCIEKNNTHTHTRVVRLIVIVGQAQCCNVGLACFTCILVLIWRGK